jgi:hypothetical protein
LRAQAELTDLKADRTLKLKFREFSLDTFWLFVREENSVISEMAVKIFLPFSTMYLSALGCSAPTEIKTSDMERMRTTDEEMSCIVHSFSTYQCPTLNEAGKNIEQQSEV